MNDQPDSPWPDSVPSLAALPDIADVPLEAGWFGRGNPAAVPSAMPDHVRRDQARRTRVDWAREDPEEFDDDDDDDDDHDLHPSRRPRKKRRLLKTAVVLIVMGFMAAGLTTFYAQRQFNSIERVAVADVLAFDSSEGTNYLIVGSDSRENLDPNVENAGAIFGDGSQDIGGHRTDTIQILRIANDGTQHVLALPRDLYIPIGTTGSSNRINAAYAQGGPELLIATIEGSLGIPIHHYAEIDFGGFIDLVDAVGGVTIDFEHPAFDLKTGLNIPEPGPATLDSTQALAFVRSRSYTEVIDGQQVVDYRSDLGRVKRQQAFLQALFSKLNDPRSQLAVLSSVDASTGALKIDDELSFTEILGLANDVRALEPNNDLDLVVNGTTLSSGAQVLILDQAASQTTLDFFSR